tara:strand:- start:244 stop:414 length:171 start_codon:yes stop_codon:yes gene_type:complete
LVSAFAVAVTHSTEKDGYGGVLLDPNGPIIGDARFESFAFDSPGYEVAKSAVLLGH